MTEEVDMKKANKAAQDFQFIEAAKAKRKRKNEKRLKDRARREAKP